MWDSGDEEGEPTMDLIYVYEGPEGSGIRGKLSQGNYKDVLNLMNNPQGVTCVVLAASDFQDPGPVPALVIKAPFDDVVEPDEAERVKITQIASEAAQRVAAMVKNGQHVLVTCWAGLNRSGLISALALIHFGFSADDAIEVVRKGRSKHALCNSTFVDIVKSVGAKNA